MPLPQRTDPLLDRLTDEQLVAAGDSDPLVYIEAAPGSGKTTVAAQRFGCQRFAPPGTDGNDPRPVLAVSFTKSATAELRRRVLADWGSVAVQRPNRIVTLDTIVGELLSALLQTGRVAWPGGHTALEVNDSWRVRVAHERRSEDSFLELRKGVVLVVTKNRRKKEVRPDPDQFRVAVEEGVATYDAVRSILEQALKESKNREFVRERLRAVARAIIVDEIYDANHLDLAIVNLAAEAGLAITLIGDPWQALYSFRGAQPALVPDLVKEAGFRSLPLTKSFRWRTQEQSDLADGMRLGEGVELPLGSLNDIDVALALEWKSLWALGPGVLPLAFGRATGRTDEAAATLLLNCFTLSVLNMRAVFVGDALTTLGIVDPSAVRRLEPALREVLAALQGSPEDKVVREAYAMLATAVRSESQREQPALHWQRLVRLKELRARVTSTTAKMVSGLTVHQAKGREWDRVGVHLTPEEVDVLKGGLSKTDESHRPLYVALTRARMSTVAVNP